MCRGKDHGNRRCPADTSEARLARRHNAQLKDTFTPLLVKVASPIQDNSTLAMRHKNTQQDETILSPSDKLQKVFNDYLKAQKSFYDSVLQDKTQLMRATERLGAAILDVAEQNYASPLDEDLQSAERRDDQLALERYEKNQSDQKTISKLIGQMRDDLTKNDEKYTALLQKIGEKVTEEKYSTMSIEEKASYISMNFPEEQTQLNALEEKGQTILSEIEKKSAERTKVVNDYLTEKYQQNDKNNKVHELLIQRNQAYQKSLSELGVQFADPESLKVSDKSDPKRVKELKRALEFYPQSWVDNSNKYADENERPLLIKNTVARAHYEHRGVSTGFEMKPKTMIYAMSSQWSPDPQSYHDQSYIEVNQETGAWTNPETGKVEYVAKSALGYPGEVLWIKAEYQHYHPLNEDDKPRGKQWQVIEGDWSKNGGTSKVYRKMKKQRANNVRSDVSNLLVSTEHTAAFAKSGVSVAMHEFAHRVESTTPHIGMLEHEFLMSRVTDEAGNVEEITSIYPHSTKRELGYKDSFPDHYMGKVYASNNREILSMGMESVFAGSSGGLSGLKDMKPDPGLKKFILGLLAGSAYKHGMKPQE